MTASSTLPSALDYADALVAENSRLAVFLDYDGTLTPIVSRPEEATLSSRMRSRVRKLAAIYPVTIVSGRGRRDVEQMVGISRLGYVGSHGFDILGPRGSAVSREVAIKTLPQLDAAENDLRQALGTIQGALVERKRFGVAIHFRLAADASFGKIEAAVSKALRHYPGLRRAEGKKVLELRPDVDWDKGQAVLWLLERLDLQNAHPIHLGDDLTDETVFCALTGRGTGIFVGAETRPTSATLRLNGPQEVGEFIDRLITGHKTAPG